MTAVHVAYSADKVYGPYAGISLASILGKFPYDWRDVHFHLLSDNIDEKDIAKLQHFVSRKGFTKLSVYNLRDCFTDGMTFLRRSSKYITPASYGRFFLAEILPLDRVIYLDCDTIATTDITELWNLADGIELIAACSDRYVNAGFLDYKKQIGLPEKSIYFNAGVLVLNLDRWRKQNIKRTLLDVADQFPNCRFYDQDILNVAFVGKFDLLPQEWNAQLNGDSVCQAEPKIVHYVGPIKPWHILYKGEKQELFKDAKRESPFRYKLPETGLGKTIARLQRSVRKRIG